MSSTPAPGATTSPRFARRPSPTPSDDLDYSSGSEYASAPSSPTREPSYSAAHVATDSPPRSRTRSRKDSGLPSPARSPPTAPIPRFSPGEESTLLAESNAIKADANTLFARDAYSDAISAYDRALASCPVYLHYEIAVLKSNIAACHLKLSEWKTAVEAATEALDGLELELPSGRKKGKGKGEGGGVNEGEAQGEVVEIDAEDEDEVAAKVAALNLSDERRRQILSLRTKSLLRRAKANVELGGWGPLGAAVEGASSSLSLFCRMFSLTLFLLTHHSRVALTRSPHQPSTKSAPDFTLLALPPLSTVLPPGDLRFVKSQLVLLPPRVRAAQEKETAEMMGKLKDLGNGLLKPFGLSTDMFNFVKDEASGGYSMSFGK